MFILQTKQQLTKAIEKAKKVRCAVKFHAFGNYSVKGSKGFYTVVCVKDSQGNKKVQCECKRALKGRVCYHAAAALAVHTGLARQQQAV